MGKKSRPLRMSPQDRKLLETWMRAKTAPQRVAFRAHICLLAADGLSATDIATRLNTSRPTVLLWKKRFEDLGPDGLTKDAPRGPSPRRLDAATRQAIVDASVNTAPPDGSYWTTRTLAKALGVSNATVSRVWRACGIKPQRKISGSRSKDNESDHKVSELVGVYVHPPLKALVVCVGPKPSRPGPGTDVEEIRFQERSSPASFGRDEHGCGTCLSAALDLLDAAITEVPDDPLNGTGLLAFLRGIERDVHGTSELHVFLKTDWRGFPSFVDQWVKGRPRVHIHSYPVSHSGNKDIREAVEAVTGNWPVRGGSEHIPSLVAAVHDFVRDCDGSPKPFVWTRKGTPAGEEVPMCKAILETMRYLGSLVAAAQRSRPGRSQATHIPGEDPLHWKQKLQSWFAAAAFAEEGEHNAALEIASTPIPDAQEATAALPSLSRAFAAVAFAEENCQETASDIFFGARRKNSFLSTVGLANVRVWRGTASAEESFAEAIGLVGVRYRLVSVSL